MSPAHTPLSQTPVLSSTAVSPPSPLNPIQDHTATHPDHSVLTPTPTALTSPSGPNTTPLYSFVTTSPVVTTTTTTQPSLITKQPSTTTTQPISSTQSFPRLRTTRPPPWTAPHPNQGSPSAGTSSGLSPSPPPSTISSTHRPRVFILPDRPATIKEESIELLLQVILEESSSDPPVSLGYYTTSLLTHTQSVNRLLSTPVC
ncbi:mucin-2-like [Oncorhynchus tshawytscha]|uniref:mucin-2-like n=1 Tax=Oncorhynchus tshawytscha TaxID=74940 RepID=UPI001C3C9858|nr:mucin-2-like [Oncorhynchus tshawytscha]